MTPLRQRMTHDMTVRGLAENTKKSYLNQGNRYPVITATTVACSSCRQRQHDRRAPPRHRAMIETAQSVRADGDFHHMIKSGSWARPRRVIANVEHRPQHQQRYRFLVSSFNRHRVPPGELYENIYCPRGDIETLRCQFES